MFQRRREFLRLRLAATDAVVIATAFQAAYLLRAHLPMLQLFYFDALRGFGLLTAVICIWVGTGFAIDSYRGYEPFQLRRATFDMLRQTGWSTAILVGLLYALKLGDISRLFTLLFICLNTFLLLTRRMLSSGLVRVAAGDTAKRYYVIVGTGEEASRVGSLIESDATGSAEVVAFIRHHSREEQADASLTETLGGKYPRRIHETEVLSQMLKDHAVDEVIIAVDRQDLRQLQGVFEACQEEGVKVRVVLNFFPMTASAVSLDRLHDLPLLTFSTAPDNDYLLFAKRIFDVTVASLMAIVLAPLSFLVAIAIRSSSKGPILFAQERCGLNGRHFRLFKFRSMHENAHAERESLAGLNEMDGPVFKCANDPRITRLGRVLRRFSIDEWPQLFNVIRGDMSLVGPRPPLPEEVERYQRWQRRRLRMRPGLTCLWVLAGRNKLDFFSWMRLDLHYIDHWSLALDCKILLQSIPHVLAGKGM